MAVRSAAWVLLAGALSSWSAHGAIYRCEVAGAVTYSDRACAAFAPKAELPALSVVAPDAGSAGIGATLFEEAWRNHEARREAAAASPPRAERPQRRVRERKRR